MKAGVPEDGRAATDLSVLVLDFWRASLGDERREDALEGERDEVAVEEEVFEEVVYFGELWVS